MITVPVETEVRHCQTCGMGICPGPDATPEERAKAVEYQSREWAQKDIPQEEWEEWVREFVAAQIRCASGRLVEAAERVYQNRDKLFSEPNEIHRLIKSMGRRLNEVRGLK